jgi:hypothetical protein
VFVANNVEKWLKVYKMNRGADGRDLLVVVLGVCRLFQVV